MSMPEVGNQPNPDREDDDQRHPDHEVRHRVEDQADPAADAVPHSAPSPAGIGADAEADHDRDQLRQADQQDGRPEPLPDDVRDRRAAELERIAQVTRQRRGRVRDELVRDERLVQAPILADLLDLGLGQVLVAQEDALGRARHHPEEHEVEHDDREDRQDGLGATTRQVVAAHRPLPSGQAGWSPRRRRSITLRPREPYCASGCTGRARRR